MTNREPAESNPASIDALPRCAQRVSPPSSPVQAAVELVFAIETGFKIPAVAITAARDSREHAKEAGFTAFVAKPLDPFVLALVVKLLAKGPPVQ